MVYVAVAEGGVELTLRYPCRPWERRGSGSELWERVPDAFNRYPDVTLAYPTQRLNLAREILSRLDEVDASGAQDPGLESPNV